MKERYQYIQFGQMPSGGRKTSIWFCHNNSSGEKIGVVKWYGPWRQYCFFAKVASVYSAGCLKDIQDFIAQLMKQRTEAKGK